MLQLNVELPASNTKIKMRKIYNHILAPENQIKGAVPFPSVVWW